MALITSSLLHINILHLAFNLYWLWAFGTAVERRYGWLKTLLIYVFLSTVSGLAEFAFLEGGVGLSGVGYGLFGLIYFLAQYDKSFAGVMDEKTVRLFVIWFFFCIATTVIGIMPVANIAHGVGAIAGGMLACAMMYEGSHSKVFTSALVVMSIAFLLLGSVGWEKVNMSSGVSRDLWRRGLEALERDDNEKAAELFRRAVKSDKTQDGLWINLGLSYERLNRRDEALDAYEHAFALKPGDAKTKDLVRDIKSELALELEREGDDAFERKNWSTAQMKYLASLRLDPTQGEVWQRIAECYSKLGKKTEAEQALKLAKANGADAVDAPLPELKHSPTKSREK